MCCVVRSEDVRDAMDVVGVPYFPYTPSPQYTLPVPELAPRPPRTPLSPRTPPLGPRFGPAPTSPFGPAPPFGLAPTPTPTPPFGLAPTPAPAPAPAPAPRERLARALDALRVATTVAPRLEEGPALDAVLRVGAAGMAATVAELAETPAPERPAARRFLRDQVRRGPLRAPSLPPSAAANGARHDALLAEERTERARLARYDPDALRRMERASATLAGARGPGVAAFQARVVLSRVLAAGSVLSAVVYLTPETLAAPIVGAGAAAWLGALRAAGGATAFHALLRVLPAAGAGYREAGAPGALAAGVAGTAAARVASYALTGVLHGVAGLAGLEGGALLAGIDLLVTPLVAGATAGAAVAVVRGMRWYRQRVVRSERLALLAEARAAAAARWDVLDALYFAPRAAATAGDAAARFLRREAARFAPQFLGRLPLPTGEAWRGAFRPYALGALLRVAVTGALAVALFEMSRDVLAAAPAALLAAPPELDLAWRGVAAPMLARLALRRDPLVRPMVERAVRRFVPEGELQAAVRARALLRRRFDIEVAWALSYREAALALFGTFETVAVGGALGELLSLGRALELGAAPSPAAAADVVAAAWTRAADAAAGWVRAGRDSLAVSWRSLASQLLGAADGLAAGDLLRESLPDATGALPARYLVTRVDERLGIAWVLPLPAPDAPAPPLFPSPEAVPIAAPVAVRLEEAHVAFSGLEVAPQPSITTTTTVMTTAAAAEVSPAMLVPGSALRDPGGRALTVYAVDRVSGVVWLAGAGDAPLELRAPGAPWRGWTLLGRTGPGRVVEPWVSLDPAARDALRTLWQHQPPLPERLLAAEAIAPAQAATLAEDARLAAAERAAVRRLAGLRDAYARELAPDLQRHEEATRALVAARAAAAAGEYPRALALLTGEGASPASPEAYAVLAPEAYAVLAAEAGLSDADAAALARYYAERAPAPGAEPGGATLRTFWEGVGALLGAERAPAAVRASVEALTAAYARQVDAYGAGAVEPRVRELDAQDVRLAAWDSALDGALADWTARLDAYTGLAPPERQAAPLPRADLSDAQLAGVRPSLVAEAALRVGGGSVQEVLEAARAELEGFHRAGVEARLLYAPTTLGPRDRDLLRRMAVADPAWVRRAFEAARSRARLAAAGPTPRAAAETEARLLAVELEAVARRAAELAARDLPGIELWRTAEWAEYARALAEPRAAPPPVLLSSLAAAAAGTARSWWAMVFGGDPSAVRGAPPGYAAPAERLRALADTELVAAIGARSDAMLAWARASGDVEAETALRALVAAPTGATTPALTAAQRESLSGAARRYAADYRALVAAVGRSALRDAVPAGCLLDLNAVDPTTGAPLPGRAACFPMATGAVLLARLLDLPPDTPEANRLLAWLVGTVRAQLSGLVETAVATPLALAETGSLNFLLDWMPLMHQTVAALGETARQQGSVRALEALAAARPDLQEWARWGGAAEGPLPHALSLLASLYCAAPGVRCPSAGEGAPVSLLEVLWSLGPRALAEDPDVGRAARLLLTPADRVDLLRPADHDAALAAFARAGSAGDWPGLAGAYADLFWGTRGRGAVRAHYDAFAQACLDYGTAALEASIEQPTELVRDVRLALRELDPALSGDLLRLARTLRYVGEARLLIGLRPPTGMMLVQRALGTLLSWTRSRGFLYASGVALALSSLLLRAGYAPRLTGALERALRVSFGVASGTLRVARWGASAVLALALSGGYASFVVGSTLLGVPWLPLVAAGTVWVTLGGARFAARILRFVAATAWLTGASAVSAIAPAPAPAPVTIALPAPGGVPTALAPPTSALALPSATTTTTTTVRYPRSPTATGRTGTPRAF